MKVSDHNSTVLTFEQCDEGKPTCVRCEKGSRECSYPLFFKKSSKARSKAVDTRPDYISESDSDFSSSGVEESLTELVKFDSVTSHPRVDQDILGELQVSQQILIDSPRSQSDDFELIFDSHSPLLSPRNVTPDAYCESVRLQSASPASAIDILSIPRSPRSNKPQSVQFFLKFHQETITAAHYFRFYDYQQLSTKLLLEMAEQSDALRHAMVAFSALIYSLKINRVSREIAFFYYSVALRDLRSLLDKPSIWLDEYHIAVATALQLSSVDVILLSFLVLILAFLWRAL